ncbi:MFS transporter [Streptomyces sp. SP17BM10]|uniref:MFS transporter n=1 Tax=Streptomyces sp. SP17BM10 TaxID=3002530 RepID=UPI002E772E2D|nr:MFS transporter [Streptomyces sp. SP17BM10]MEE1782949.1 MFS transporter [Streptomyces sp. SP17BM10]
MSGAATTRTDAAADAPGSPTRVRLYLAARSIDAVGSGLWMPISLFFFVQAQRLPVEQVGAALTAGAVFGLVAGPFGGTLVDRFGPGPVVLVSNVVRAVGFLLYPLVGTVWQVALIAAANSAGDRIFWTANTPLLARLAGERKLVGALGNMSIVRIAGLGIGAGLAGLVGRSTAGLHALAWANGASFAVAAVLVCAVLRVPGPSRTGGNTPDGPGRTWGTVLRDRPYLVLCLVQVLFTFAANSLTVALPLVAVRTLRGPVWLAGASVLVGNIVLMVAVKPAIAYGRRTSRLRALTAAAAVFAVTFLLMAPAQLAAPALVVPLVLLVSVLGVTAEALFGSVMSAAAYEAAPEGLKGRYNALFQTAYGASGALAPAVFTALLAVGNAVLWLALVASSALIVPVLRVAAVRLPGAHLTPAPPAVVPPAPAPLPEST